MTDDTRELIEELKELFGDGWCICTRDGLTERVIAVLEASLPTEDDREALAKALFDADAPVVGYERRYPDEGNEDVQTGQEWRYYLPMADRLAAGFRRPSPVTREALKTVADAIRRNCTPDLDAYQSGGDALIAAVADWVENPPDWVTALRSLPEPAEVEWECKMGGLGWGPCDAEGCQNPRRYRVKVKLNPWVPVKGTEQ